MPTYGRSFTLADPDKYGVHSPASGGGKEGTYTKESGFLAYYEVSRKFSMMILGDINDLFPVL